MFFSTDLCHYILAASLDINESYHMKECWLPGCDIPTLPECINNFSYSSYILLTMSAILIQSLDLLQTIIAAIQWSVTMNHC